MPRPPPLVAPLPAPSPPSTDHHLVFRVVLALAVLHLFDDNRPCLDEGDPTTGGRTKENLLRTQTNTTKTKQNKNKQSNLRSLRADHRVPHPLPLPLSLSPFYKTKKKETFVCPYKLVCILLCAELRRLPQTCSSTLPTNEKRNRDRSFIFSLFALRVCACGSTVT